MKVAIAGRGNVAQYLVEELAASGHEIVVLTRSANPDSKPYEQRQTDYSVASLVSVLEDVDALVSTVVDYNNTELSTSLHLDMLEACKQSKKTKTFIPSEWTVNIEDHPDQPMFFADHNRDLPAALKKATDIRSTIIQNSWFADYIVPQKQRHLRDIGELFPVDHDKKLFTIYSPGTQLVTFTSVRDVAKVVGAMLNAREPWPLYTFVSGDQLSWNDLFAILKKRDPEWESQTKSLTQIVQHIIDSKSPEDALVPQFEIQSYSGALTFPEDKVELHRSKYFPDIHVRTVEEILDDAAKNPDQIV